jgi:stringent starvation protein B
MLRALYEWIVDNDCTPYVVISALREDAQIPRNYVKDDQIVLNISPTAVMGLKLDNDGLMFSARFGGVPMEVYAPIGAVLGIYARENGQGMVFEAEETPTEPPPAPPAPAGGKPNRPGLKVVK